MGYSESEGDIFLYKLIERTARVTKVDRETCEQCFRKAISLDYDTLR